MRLGALVGRLLDRGMTSEIHRGRRYLLVGATGGIGSAVARRLRDQGASLVLAARRPEPLAALGAALGASHRVLDARDFDATAALFDEVAAGGLDGAACFAGSIVLRPAHATSAADYREVLAQNLDTAFSVTRAAGKTLGRTGGSLLLFSTGAASVGLPGHEAIAAAKAGVEGLVRSAAATYAAKGLRVNAIAPGLVETPLSARLVANDASRQASVAMHALGRLGVPEDIAACAAWLLGPESSWVTGQIVGIDGGLARVRSR
jgi:NAD(P)-dependent dehydrogenase (short-subunit alcohol dehydrogenase family)